MSGGSPNGENAALPIVMCRVKRSAAILALLAGPLAWAAPANAQVQTQASVQAPAYIAYNSLADFSAVSQDSEVAGQSTSREPQADASAAESGDSIEFEADELA